MDITIQVTGWDELIKKTQDPSLIGEPMRDFFNNATMEIQGNVQELTPVDTGELRGSITSLVDTSPVPQWGEVTTRLQPHYGPDMEYGTEPHWVPIAALIGWASRHGMNPYAIQRKIARYGTRARNFFSVGVENSMAAIQGFIVDAGNAIEDRWSK